MEKWVIFAQITPYLTASEATGTISLSQNSSPKLLQEQGMRLLFGVGIIWCVAMFVAVALCRAASSQDVREQVGD
ncbi:MAG TPA: hypothetical protein VJR04_06780 [Terriglobales bacterium]|nr:hypothetical protein [Terriglobales bacterium]